MKIKRTKQTNKAYITFGEGAMCHPPYLTFFSAVLNSETSSHLVVLFPQGGGRHLRWNLVARRVFGWKLPPKNAGWKGETWTNTQHFKGFLSSWLKIHPDFFWTKSVWVFVENNISEKFIFHQPWKSLSLFSSFFLLKVRIMWTDLKPANPP